ncbi:aldo/keto reductase [Ancylobacter sp. MQZ15Z-1]|uniref:Aldo/keto reductase n=2 Tax=Ancylobacter mangrovi TaxID=2972472 RepID=A0A9X2T921_9HYPH|nr:aldo/keto reductase [Ancylobacter mangrovi]MCS0497753.1 aldo/keto reductase [Ancylobacter mangrovi]
MSTHMPARRLGRSGLTVSRLALGAMNFGARTDEAESLRMIAAAAEAGVNFIDTADTYAGGRSEEIVGKAIAADRDAWVLATKLANRNGPGLNDRGLSRKWILHEAHQSLRRLGTDYVDILYLHMEDPLTPMEETVRALGQLQRDGAIRYFGVSNHSAWRIAALCALCDQEGIDRPVVSQPLYHALDRTAERELLPACRHFGLGVAVYSPTARGILSGKYRPDAPPPPDSRVAVADRRILEAAYHPDSVVAAMRIAGYAAERGVPPTAFALAWVLANDYVTSCIVGPRTFEQWQDYLAVLDVTWTAEDETTVDAIVPRGATAAPGLVDPKFAIEGREGPARTG